MRPVLLVVAGPNGAGKTTLADRLREERWSEGLEFVDSCEAARLRLGERKGVALETVLSRDDEVDVLHRARASGYFVRLFFLGTRNPRINTGRVAARVMEGGLTVPIEEIVARYGSSMGNLSAAVRLANRAYVYDNSTEDEEAMLCFRTEDGLLRKIFGDLPAWVERAVGGLERHAGFEDLRLE
jgi:predicted ABC-type ATPase